MWKVKKEKKKPKRSQKEAKKQNENLIVGRIHTIRALSLGFYGFTEPPGVYISILVPSNIMKQKFIL